MVALSLVSIIVPNYNHAHFLKKRLDSIVQQTYENVEIILLDDSSTDNSLNILNKYAQHPKISQLVTNKKNSGSTFKQWKKGIDLSKGKYIWIAESDDWADTHFLEKMVAILESDQAISLAYCQSIVVNADGKKLYSMLNWTDRFHPNKWEKQFITSGNQEIRQSLIYQNNIPNASAVVFRNNNDLVNFVHKKLSIVGDWWFWIHLIKDKKIAFLPEELNFFRKHSQTTRENLDLIKKKQNTLENLLVLQLVKRFFPEISSTIKKQEKKRILRLIHWVYPNNFQSIKPFVTQYLPNENSFYLLVLQSYTNWFISKIKGIKRRIRRIHRTIQ